MKKYFFAVIIRIIILFPYKVYAADYNRQIDSLLDEYNIPQEYTSNLTIENIYNFFIEKALDSLYEPIRLGVKLCTVIMLCATVKVLQNDTKDTNDITDTVSCLMTFTILLGPVTELLNIISENLFTIKNFMTSFLPVYAGISMASGELVTSGIYSGFFLTAIIFITNFTVKIIIPAIQFYFAMIISNALSPYIKLQSLCDFYIKVVKWIMRSIVSVICFILTIQTTISQGKDTMVLKAGKALAGSAIPVIGSVLQDAVGSVYAGMEAIKGYAGAAGIIGAVSIFMPSVITLSIYWFVINIVNILCEIFGLKSVSLCVKGYINVIEITQSILFLFMVLFIFSLAIMVSLTNGV